ncbi:hypothetical protein QFZ49_008049 [Streptomyces turgidiscabies]|uniref:Transposase n=1 Tax=Streptomyces turgidiscabies TaxID=85558 RepID=A0ABU0S1D9_9ACTN|nr:hypothetical protein [Streptomyces turgidiscabies]MDQ0938067.1 hypothetical protein [Streptomyces turgidiscabies]
MRSRRRLLTQQLKPPVVDPLALPWRLGQEELQPLHSRHPRFGHRFRSEHPRVGGRTAGQQHARHPNAEHPSVGGTDVGTGSEFQGTDVKGSDLTFAAWVRHERLLRIRLDLAAPACSNISTAAIAAK